MTFAISADHSTFSPKHLCFESTPPKSPFHSQGGFPCATAQAIPSDVSYTYKVLRGGKHNAVNISEPPCFQEELLFLPPARDQQIKVVEIFIWYLPDSNALHTYNTVMCTVREPREVSFFHPQRTKIGLYSECLILD